MAEEIWDIYDANWCRTGRTVVREKAWGFDDFYTVIQDVNPDQLVLQTEEVAEVRWATLEEVRRMERDHTFVPYFPGLIELMWQIRDNYDGAICRTGFDGIPSVGYFPEGTCIL